MPHEALLFGRNDYAPSPARLKTVLFKNVSDAGTRRLLLLKGDADVAYDLGADQFDSLRNAPGVRIEQADAPRVYYLGFNTGSKDNPALGNPALWQAARWLVDYQSIAEQLLKGQYRVHQAFLPQGLDGALDDRPFKLDVDKARQILREAGIAEGTRISLIVINQPPYTDIAQALQASFAQAGLRLDIQPVVESDLWGKMRGRDFQAIFTYWGADYRIRTPTPAPLPTTCPVGRNPAGAPSGAFPPSARKRVPRPRRATAPRAAHVTSRCNVNCRSVHPMWWLCRGKRWWHCGTTLKMPGWISPTACCIWTG